MSSSNVAKSVNFLFSAVYPSNLLPSGLVISTFVFPVFSTPTLASWGAESLSIAAYTAPTLFTESLGVLTPAHIVFEPYNDVNDEISEICV